MGQDTTSARDSLRQQLARLQRQVDSLRAVAERQETRIMELDERTAGGAGPQRAAADTGRRALPSARGIYGKPFVRRFGSGAAVGGYVDVEFLSNLEDGTSAFDAHRLVPFLFAEVTDRLHFGTEIEFEHGPTLEVEHGSAEGNGEINVEFATIDYRIREALNFRGGIVLSPLGRFNLVHDSPVNDLTDRPLVDLQVIPTTLSETGMGFFGTLYPSERSVLSYELYVVNGFTEELVETDEVVGGGLRLNVREARGLRGGIGNATKNVVGRLAFSPLLGLEVGASAHVGTYGESGDGEGEEGDRSARIWALDATFTRGPLELLGEWARLSADLPDTLRTLGVANARDGYYAQLNWHFGYGALGPKSSVFTAAARWDHVDFSRGVPGDVGERLTLGLNWRPVEDAAFKTDFQWNWATPRGNSMRGPAERRLVLSVATYF